MVLKTFQYKVISHDFHLYYFLPVHSSHSLCIVYVFQVWLPLSFGKQT